jgi:hypothetical protein
MVADRSCTAPFGEVLRSRGGDVGGEVEGIAGDQRYISRAAVDLSVMNMRVRVVVNCQ